MAPMACVPPVGTRGWVGKERCEVCCHGNGAHPWPPTTVGDTKSFMEVEMADIGANLSRLDESHHGIHICPIHIDLTAILVNRGTDVPDGFFKDAVRGRIGHHEGGEGVLILDAFGF